MKNIDICKASLSNVYWWLDKSKEANDIDECYESLGFAILTLQGIQARVSVPEKLCELLSENSNESPDEFFDTDSTFNGEIM